MALHFQVLDYSLLFRYCQQLSQYHMQIEDDVMIGHDYLEQIKDYISAITIRLNIDAVSLLFNKLTHFETKYVMHRLLPHFYSKIRWSFLDFSWLGFIGKLFRSDQMSKMAIFYNMYFDEMPIDWLINYFTFISGQRQSHHHLPSLLQHFGTKSSFDTSKDNLLKDKLIILIILVRINIANNSHNTSL